MKLTTKIKYLKGAGKFLLILGTLLACVRSTIHNSVVSNWLWSYLLVLGAWLYWRARQYADKAIAERVISDSKPHVLYLRSFGTDPAFTATAAGAISGWLTEEEQLCEALQPFGEVVAIGKPGETLPTPGAARLYATDADWKQVVTDQMHAARLVVIRAGTSGGLLWELKEVVRVVDPKKLLILILNINKKDYGSFKEQADQIFNVRFPEADELKRIGEISGFVRFSPDWSPKFLPLGAPFLADSYKPYRTRFTFTLRPVFEEYGLEWKAPRRLASFWVILVFASVLVPLANMLLKIAMHYCCSHWHWLC